MITRLSLFFSYVSLPNVCQLAKPNSIKTFKLDPSFFDFDSIPPPKLPTPDKKENSKSTSPQENRTKEEIQEVKEEEAELHEASEKRPNLFEHKNFQVLFFCVHFSPITSNRLVETERQPWTRKLKIPQRQRNSPGSCTLLRSNRHIPKLL